MATKRALTLVILMLSIAEPTEAAKYTAIGPGGSSCGTWLAMRRIHQEDIYEAWVLGFLSGIGFVGSEYSAGPLSGMDADGVAEWIDNYCRDHPIKTISDAAVAFFVTHPH